MAEFINLAELALTAYETPEAGADELLRQELTALYKRLSGGRVLFGPTRINFAKQAIHLHVADVDQPLISVVFKGLILVCYLDEHIDLEHFSTPERTEAFFETRAAEQLGQAKTALLAAGWNLDLPATLQAPLADRLTEARALLRSVGCTVTGGSATLLSPGTFNVGAARLLLDTARPLLAEQGALSSELHEMLERAVREIVVLRAHADAPPARDPRLDPQPGDLREWIGEDPPFWSNPTVQIRVLSVSGDSLCVVCKNKTGHEETHRDYPRSAWSDPVLSDKKNWRYVEALRWTTTTSC